MNLPDDAGAVLLPLARHAIARALKAPQGPQPADAPWLDETGAAFVTLTKDGQLRGCIGTLEAHQSLRADVEENAVNAATRDPRFTPMRAGELDQVEVEVSVLETPQPFLVESRADALAQLRPHEDGLIFRFGPYRATFLPQVWEQLPEPEQFLDRLIAKAGLQPGFWDDEVHLYRYSVHSWSEQ